LLIILSANVSVDYLFPSDAVIEIIVSPVGVVSVGEILNVSMLSNFTKFKTGEVLNVTVWPSASRTLIFYVLVSPIYTLTVGIGEF
jgi:hypothetical protein